MGFSDLEREKAAQKEWWKNYKKGEKEKKRSAEKLQKEYADSCRDALQSSVVPGLAKQLDRAVGNSFVNRPKVTESGGIQIYVRSGMICDEHSSDVTQEYLSIHGRLDGSVIIGNTTLSASEAKNKKLVEQVLTEEFRKT
jgi:hypothetical protein